MKKFVVCFLLSLFSRVFLVKKGATTWGVCGSFKSALLPLKSLLLAKKVQRYKVHCKAPNYTTTVM